MQARSSWLIPVSSAFAVSSIVTLVAFSFAPGCQTRCQIASDCGANSYCSPETGRCVTDCFTDLDCRQPPECQSNQQACTPKGLYCDPYGRCQGSYQIARTSTSVKVMGPDVGAPVTGWDLPPAAGRAFIVNQLAIADKGQGFDLNGDCDATTNTGCADNALWELGQLGNDQIAQGLAGGETLLLLELAGLEQPYRGDQKSLTLKIYSGQDADDPVFPGNNFKVIAGQTTCCQFKIGQESLNSPPPQARARAPAKIERGRLASLLPVPIQFTLTLGDPPHPEVRLEHVLFSARIPSAISTISPGGPGIDEGLLGGAVPINTLGASPNPYCRAVSSSCQLSLPNTTLIDLVSALLSPSPDIDLAIPPQGLEAVIDTDQDGRVDLCCAGNGALSAVTTDPATSKTICANKAIPPVDPADPSTCTLNPAMVDGYSVAVTFTAVQASIVGVGE